MDGEKHDACIGMGSQIGRKTDRKNFRSIFMGDILLMGRKPVHRHFRINRSACYETVIGEADLRIMLTEPLGFILDSSPQSEIGRRNSFGDKGEIFGTHHMIVWEKIEAAV